MPERSLEDFVREVNGRSHLRVEYDFGGGFVRLETSEAERRQALQDIRCSEDIVLELLRNARDAHAAHVFLAMGRSGDKRTIVAIDDGDGIPHAMHGHVFEPRVTSKLDTSRRDKWGMHGRGMALYSIAENAQKAYIASSETGLGCAVAVETDVRQVGEKADQSTFPTFDLCEGGVVNVRGPRNIVRTACEFALEERDSCLVYVGSPVEIAAALFAYGTTTLSQVDRLFCQDLEALPLCKRLAAASDPESFARAAGGMGLELSARSARRIQDGQVEAALPVMQRIRILKGGAPSAEPRAKRGKRVSVRLSDAEKAALRGATESWYRDIAERYYLEPDVLASVRVGAERISVSIPVVPRASC